MSAIQDSSLLPPLHPPPNWIPPIQVQPPALPPAPEPGRIIFTRQLWQRTMPEDPREHGVSTRSQSQGSLSAYQANASTSRRNSSNVSTRSLRSAPSISGSTKAPLTPEESPPSRPTRKRSVNVVEEEDREIDSHEVTSIHTRASSGDSTAHVCICQPDPKIPRPRNGKSLHPARSSNLLTSISIHPLPSALSSQGRRSTSRSRQSRDIEDHRRGVAQPISRSQERVESPRRRGETSPSTTISHLPISTKAQRPSQQHFLRHTRISGRQAQV
jgi:hypothetical protein